jgi:tetratricopeptide (TPR) repeat protein
MIWLYSLLLLMAAMASLVLAIPYYQKKLSLASYLSIVAFIIGFSFTFYHYIGNKAGLRFWFSQGQAHYHLLTQMDALGGIDGMIAKVKMRTLNNPLEAEGWFILAKLYLNKKDVAQALVALNKARNLQPQNKEIETLYQAVSKLNQN